MREFKGRQPIRPQQQRDTFDEVVDIRNVGENIVGNDQVGSMTLFLQLYCSAAPEKHCFGRYSLGAGDSSHILCWLDAERGDATLHEILQQIAVVAGNLDNLAALV